MLKDSKTIALNGLLLFLVLCYIYPLKFLFSLMMEGNNFRQGDHILQKVTGYDQMKLLMIIYGTGFCLVYFIFFLMYVNVLSKHNEIKLNLIEQFYTRSELYKQLLLISIGLCTIAAVFILPNEFSANVGMIYFRIGPLLFIYFRFRRKRLYKMFSDEYLIAHDRWPGE